MSYNKLIVHNHTRNKYIMQFISQLKRADFLRKLIKRESVGREELAKLYNESSIVIQPSRYESFGLCVLEAMACGDAAIVSNKGGLPEVAGNAGVVLPLNSKLFIKEILKLLENFRLRERYGRRGIERARKFSWIYVSKKTLEIYKKILYSN